MQPILRSVFLGAVALGISTFALAQSTPDYGKREFEANCAVCHGMNAQGAGSWAIAFLKTQPPDLTLIAKKNGGVFPVKRVYEVIDGTDVEIQAHGPRDMPIWGQDYAAKSGEYLEYVPEAFARTRILLLVDYLNRIQKK